MDGINQGPFGELARILAVAGPPARWRPSIFRDWTQPQEGSAAIPPGYDPVAHAAQLPVTGPLNLQPGGGLPPAVTSPQNLQPGGALPPAGVSDLGAPSPGQIGPPMPWGAVGAPASSAAMPPSAFTAGSPAERALWNQASTPQGYAQLAAALSGNS
jgi:hypothetical protein